MIYLFLVKKNIFQLWHVLMQYSIAFGVAAWQIASFGFYPSFPRPALLPNRHKIVSKSSLKDIDTAKNIVW